MAQNLNENIKQELVIEAQIKSIMHTILENCKKESDCNSLLIPLEDYEDRVAYYTGLQKESLDKLLNIEPAGNMVKYDLVQRVVIMKALLKFYKNGQLPKFRDLYRSVKDVIPAPDIVQFRHALTTMGFDYRKTINGIMIVEDAELTFKRFLYLKRIKNLKNRKVHICYLDERYINKTLQFNKPDFVNDARIEGNDATHIWDGFYFYCLISDEGLENYFITNKICKAEHKKWVLDNLVKALKPECAIVIDNHPLHGELVDETVTRYHSKAYMLNWLKKRNVPCNNNMCKAELYELISRCGKPTAIYDFDKLLKAYGYEVVRLPAGFEGLSPAHLFWAELTKRMSSLSTQCTQIELENEIISAINQNHSVFWKLIKQRITYCEGVLDTLHSDTEAALENCEPFDIKNVDSHTNIPEYFYVLDSY